MSHKFVEKCKWKNKKMFAKLLTIKNEKYIIRPNKKS